LREGGAAPEPSRVAELEESMDEVLVCLLDVLGLRRMEPERPGLFANGGLETRAWLAT